MDEPIVTPVGERLRHEINERYISIDRDKLTRWMMARAANQDLEIIDCRGRRINAGLGCVFDGQLRQIFWSFVRPCIEDAVQYSCNELEGAFQHYSPSQVRGTLAYVEPMLQGFVNKIYGRMVYLDRAMRGRGDPKSVPPYDPAKELASAYELIAHKLGVLTKHYGAGPDDPKLSDVIPPKARLFGHEVHYAMGWKWVRSKWARLTERLRQAR